MVIQEYKMFKCNSDRFSLRVNVLLRNVCKSREYLEMHGLKCSAVLTYFYLNLDLENRLVFKVTLKGKNNFGIMMLFVYSQYKCSQNATRSVNCKSNVNV